MKAMLMLVLMWLIMLAKREWAAAGLVWSEMWGKALELFNYTSGKASWKLWRSLPQWLRSIVTLQPYQLGKPGKGLQDHYAAIALAEVQPPTTSQLLGMGMPATYITATGTCSISHSQGNNDAGEAGVIGLDTPALAIPRRIGTREMLQRRAHLRGRDMLHECQGIDAKKLPWCAGIVAYERFLISN